MNVTIELPDENAAALQAQAEAQGLTIERRLEQIAGQHLHPASMAHLQKTNPKEWVRQFDAWVDSHDPNTPVLSGEAAKTSTPTGFSFPRVVLNKRHLSQELQRLAD